MTSSWWWPGSQSQICVSRRQGVNILEQRQNRRHFPDDISKCILFNENVWISIQISLRFVPKGPINNIPALVQIMAWRRPGDKPLSEPMLVSLLTYICCTRPQWVNTNYACAPNMHIHRKYVFQQWHLCLLTQWIRDKMADILQTTLWYSFSWMKIGVFLFKMSLIFVPNVQLARWQIWFRKLFGAYQATSYHLNQWWLVPWRSNASPSLGDLKFFHMHAPKFFHDASFLNVFNRDN